MINERCSAKISKSRTTARYCPAERAGERKYASSSHVKLSFVPALVSWVASFSNRLALGVPRKTASSLFQVGKYEGKLALSCPATQ